jgi:hypothetical protein
VTRGVSRSLLDLVLTASFRPERHGGLLLDEDLPADLPVAGDDAAASAWSALVALQASYRERGAVDVWGFWSGVRKLHAALGFKPEEDAAERTKAVFAAMTAGPGETCQEEEARLVKWIEERDIADWHAFWGGPWTPLEERRRLIRLAGRPDLIRPDLCERFGIKA